jgi:hypothetical protein
MDGLFAEDIGAQPTRVVALSRADGEVIGMAILLN